MEDKRILHLGCGLRPIEGATNLDLWKHNDFVDVAHDLNVIPWPFGDESYDEILSYDVFEHLSVEVRDWLNECHRILVPDGLLSFRVPAWNNGVSWRDPTHKKVFHEETFDYWQPGTALWQHYGSFYFPEAKWWRGEPARRVNGGDLLFRLSKLLS